MKTKKLLTLVFVCVITLNLSAQKSTLWLTYGQSEFIYSPGLEYAFFFNRHIGLQGAVSLYVQDADPERVVNVNEDHKAYPFYNANLGVCSYVLKRDDFQVAVNLGVKMYHGSDFHRLHYYEDGGYYIYYDSFDNTLVYGVDMGMSFSYKKMSCLLKYDTAYRKVRIGLGFSFGQLD